MILPYYMNTMSYYVCINLYPIKFILIDLFPKINLSYILPRLKFIDTISYQ